MWNEILDAQSEIKVIELPYSVYWQIYDLRGDNIRYKEAVGHFIRVLGEKIGGKLGDSILPEYQGDHIFRGFRRGSDGERLYQHNIAHPDHDPKLTSMDSSISATVQNILDFGLDQRVEDTSLGYLQVDLSVGDANYCIEHFFMPKLIRGDGSENDELRREYGVLDVSFLLIYSRPENFQIVPPDIIKSITLPQGKTIKDYLEGVICIKWVAD